MFVYAADLLNCLLSLDEQQKRDHWEKLDEVWPFGLARMTEFPEWQGDNGWDSTAWIVQQASYSRERAREPHHQEAGRYSVENGSVINVKPESTTAENAGGERTLHRIPKISHLHPSGELAFGYLPQRGNLWPARFGQKHSYLWEKRTDRQVI